MSDIEILICADERKAQILQDYLRAHIEDLSKTSKMSVKELNEIIERIILA